MQANGVDPQHPSARGPHVDDDSLRHPRAGTAGIDEISHERQNVDLPAVIGKFTAQTAGDELLAIGQVRDNGTRCLHQCQPVAEGPGATNVGRHERADSGERHRDNRERNQRFDQRESGLIAAGFEVS